MTLAAAHDHTAFVVVFAIFVLLCLVLVAFVVRFAVKLGRERRSAPQSVKRSRRAGSP